MIGQTISHYRIVENLGTGMGWSTRAEDTRLHRFIAFMRGFIRSFANSRTLAAVVILLPALLLAADVDTRFHNAPASAQAAKNPYAGQEEAVQAGQKLYARNCLSCHGKRGNGTGKEPSLVDGRLDSVTPGEVFWFITRGDKENGMPAWGSLPAKQRWQIVTYVKSMGTPQGTSQAAQGKRAAVIRHEHIEAEGTAADPALHRFSLRETGNVSQDHGERST